MEEESVWGGCDGLVAAALGAVFEWLGGRELARAGAVCRAWRRAAAAPTLWRHLLQIECGANARALKALADHNAAAWQSQTEDKTETATESEFVEYPWRDEYVRTVAGWRHVCSLRPTTASPARAASPEAERGAAGASGAALLHAALAPQGDALIVAAEDASITVFIRTGQSADAWSVTWQACLRRRGWRAASRVEWAPDEGAGAARGGRVLVAGPLALSERWELLVLELGVGCEQTRVLARAGGAAGAGGCWLTHDTFLSLELRLLAPGRGVTTIWLNSATQEEQSEFVGVAAPVLRVYNEAQAHITHVAVVEIPTESAELEPRALGLDAQYILAALPAPRPAVAPPRLLLAACGRTGGPAGTAAALGCWPLRARGVPPLCAAERGGLAERVARRRRAPRVLDPEPPVPTEDEVRALCSPPAALCPLSARLLGLTPHPSGRCVWVLESGGRATCAALPALGVLRVLDAHDVTPAAHPHYVQPALSDYFIASPVGDDWGHVAVWSAASGARCSAPDDPSPRAAAPCALLPPADTLHTPAQLLVLAGDVIFVWESCATPQSTF